MISKEFTAYLQSKNLSENTIARYLESIQKFVEFTAKEVVQITKKDILNYLEYLQKKGNQNNTKQKALGIINHYFTYLCKEQKVLQNPTHFIKIRGVKRQILHSILSFEELTEFTDLYFYEHQDKRNYLILSLCVYQGLIKTEWKNLKISNIDTMKGTVFIEKTRRTNARKMSLQPAQIGVLFAFLQNRENKEEPLFVNTPAVDKWVKKLKKIYPKFTDFKQIRASIITHWIQTLGLRKAQYLAGHRYISSTEKYLQNDLESLKNELNNFHPLG